MSKIGIVTVLYNSASVLSEFFKTLDIQKYKDFTLYVIDNNSSDDSLNQAMNLSKDVSFQCKFYPQNTNWGIAKGNNIGIEAALNDGCEYILLSNNDIVLNEGTIDLLLKGMKSMDVQLAVPKIYYHEQPLIWCCGGDFHPYNGTTIQYGQRQPDSGEYSNNFKCNYAPTCFMLIHKDVFSTVGLMDERYFVYYDDTDFLWRAIKDNNLSLGVIVNSSLKHKESVSTGGYRSPFGIKYLTRNSWIFVRKNMKFPQKQITMLYMWLYNRIWKRLKYSAKDYDIMIAADKEGRNFRI